ncbi:PepSY domain-containing protein [Umezawaea endophytica]|uniref:PepSY domain-containing protein n=1 Tax=Umezawaea endophytica TaxID=1654476 RepID=A0A9X2VIN0_9PSEU|nr:PepSY domain-containing protein [Umezawaea endophytica]MCS7477410.1 PepSY domain-containing protein [Umezawaea endophytica]
MSNRNRAVLVGGTLVLLVAAGTAAAVAGADDSGTTSPTATSISVKPTTSSATSSSGTSTSTTSSSTTSTSTTAAPSSEVAGGVTAEEAGRIALDEVGGGSVVGTERELEHGRWEWHVRIEWSGGRCDVRVDEETGTVRPGDDSGHRGRRGDVHRGHGGRDDGSAHRGRGGDDH